MKTLTLFMMSILLFLGANAVARAADPQVTFDDANTEFAQKHFALSASDYQRIIARQGYSAPVLFNLANAYFQDGKLGPAILNYERAQLLAPGDSDIAFNLHIARAKAGLADRPTPWLAQAADFFSLNTLSWIACVAGFFIAVGSVTRLLTQRRSILWRAGTVACASVILATGVAVGLRWTQLQSAIVTMKNAPVYISPVTIAQPLYNLAEGQTVILDKKHGDFVLVQTGDGHRGWVKNSEVTPLIPRTQETQNAHL